MVDIIIPILQEEKKKNKTRLNVISDKLKL